MAHALQIGAAGSGHVSSVQPGIGAQVVQARSCSVVQDVVSCSFVAHVAQSTQLVPEKNFPAGQESQVRS